MFPPSGSFFIQKAEKLEGIRGGGVERTEAFPSSPTLSLLVFKDFFGLPLFLHPNVPGRLFSFFFFPEDGGGLSPKNV